MTNSKTIRDHVIESGRYDQAMNLLDREIKEYQENPKVGYPLTFTTDRVLGYDIFMGLTITKMVINACDWDLVIDIITNLDDSSINAINGAAEWIQSNTRMYLHNYANTISHRKDTFKPDMETIRLWLVVQTVVDFIRDCLSDKDCDVDTQLNEFYIPEGWKKLDTENVTVTEVIHEASTPADIIDDVINKLQTLKEVSDKYGVPIITAQQVGDNV